MLNLVLGMLARWDAGAGDAMALDGGWVDARDPAGAAPDPASRSEPRRPDPPATSPGLLAPTREAARGDAAPRSVIEGDVLPPAAPDDAATRFAPPVPASFSLIGLRAPQPDAPAAAASAGPTPDRDEPGPEGAAPSGPSGAAVRSLAAPPQPARAAAGSDDRGDDTPVAAGHAPASPGLIETPRASAAGPTERGPDGPASPDGSVPEAHPEAYPSPYADPADAQADPAAPAAPPRPGATPADVRRHEPVPGGTAPTPATAAQSLSVPDAPPPAPAARRPAMEERDAADPAAARDDRRVAAARPDPLALPVAARDRLADVDWLMGAAAPSAAPADGQVERAGVIASFILNAAMIPGWPPPRPFEMPPAAALLDRLLSSPNALPGEDDMLGYFAERGAEAGLLARMRARLSGLSRARRLRVLVGLAALWTTIEALIDALEQDLLLVSETLRGGGEDEDDDDMRRTLTA